jgi:hypothetical protein
VHSHDFLLFSNKNVDKARTRAYVWKIGIRKTMTNVHGVGSFVIIEV